MREAGHPQQQQDWGSMVKLLAEEYDACSIDV
jgi:hypothetical protein